MTDLIPTCDAFADELAAFLERDVNDATRAAMEAHALSCAGCGALLAELRALRIDAANLPELVPSRDLWPDIAARIQTPVVELSAGHRAAPKRRTGALWLGLAAAGLVAVTATVTREMMSRSTAVAPTQAVATTVTAVPDTARANAPASLAAPAASPVTTPVTSPAAPTGTRSPQATASLAANRPTAEQTYANEIDRLHTVLVRRRPQLDSATVAVVEHNLQVIDDAIAQCKAALKKDPASRYLMESLNGAMDTKVQLLRTAVALPSAS